MKKFINHTHKNCSKLYRWNVTKIKPAVQEVISCLSQLNSFSERCLEDHVIILNFRNLFSWQKSHHRKKKKKICNF